MLEEPPARPPALRMCRLRLSACVYCRPELVDRIIRPSVLSLADFHALAQIIFGRGEGGR